ncbi:hypothetical protein JTB14_000017 [Gonioctena quinquepunctata]|nr:hypothetical protein JTB14_000017 [Gonioctena quinquepunctata]
MRLIPITSLTLELSDRSKRRKTQELRKNLGTKELTYAAKIKLRADGNVAAANILDDITNIGPEYATSFIKVGEVRNNRLTEDKALSLLTEAKLTMFQYNIIRSNALEESCNLYPNYEFVIKAKKKCYPDNILITESSAEIQLQSLLDHTIKRLGLALGDVFSGLTEIKLDNIWLMSKWGCDGTSGQAEYKQSFEHSCTSDDSSFVSSLVPVRIISGEIRCKHELIWQNNRPSSPRNCRPIRLQCIHETTEILQKEAEYIAEQIKILTHTDISINDRKIRINHHSVMTMIDGKAINAITNTTSTQKCNLCGVTAKYFNKLNHSLRKSVMDKQRLQLGLSSLHAGLGSMNGC